MGTEYGVVQNVDAISFFNAIVDGDGIQYETAGALGKRECTSITPKLPVYIKVAIDDPIEKCLFLTTFHDGFGINFLVECLKINQRRLFQARKIFLPHFFQLSCFTCSIIKASNQVTGELFCTLFTWRT
ncbi:MAG TPA: DUF932 domain-containing protein [Flavisolibacter sp.]|nr:DUF932 domain-containing protein [Flavisolibacter sp.]